VLEFKGFSDFDPVLFNSSFEIFPRLESSLFESASITAVIGAGAFPLTLVASVLKFGTGGCMKDIHEVLRQKQAKYAQLGKQIEMLQQAAEKLREVAPLLAESDDEDNAVLSEVDDANSSSDAMAAKAGASGAGASSKSARPAAPRWP
jgi:uncharacterized membrane protein YhiD involved in acid resistance